MKNKNTIGLTNVPRVEADDTSLTKILKLVFYVILIMSVLLIVSGIVFMVFLILSDSFGALAHVELFGKKVFFYLKPITSMLFASAMFWKFAFWTIAYFSVGFGWFIFLVVYTHLIVKAVKFFISLMPKIKRLVDMFQQFILGDTAL